MRSAPSPKSVAIVLIVQLIAACSGGGTSNGMPTTTATAPSITTQPVSQSVTAGQIASFSVAASGTDPLSYQWKRDGAAISSATAATYASGPTTPGDNGATFTVSVSNAAGTTTSNAATLTVNAATITPSITTQPANVTVMAGQTATFSVVASGTAPLSYQWTRAGNAIAGATASSYTTAATAASDNGATFAVSVTNAAGTTTSNAATLTVNAAAGAPSITTQPANVTVTAGQTATFSVVASGTAPLSYQWKRNGNAIAGATASSYTTAATAASDNGATFSVTVGNSVGTVTSSNAVLTVNPAGTPPFGHVVIVVEENTAFSAVVGNTAAMPYLNSLIANYGLATQYYANTHPSIGNYMMLVTGQVLTNDDSQTPASFPVSANNVVRRLIASGKTWKAYAENLPSAGYTGGNTGGYIVHHEPLAYLTDVQNSTTQKKNLVPFTQFAMDLAADRLPNYAFVTPNPCDDAHDCGLDVADGWLQSNIQPLLASTPFKDDGLLIIVFDESDGDSTHGGGKVAAVLVSPAFSKSGFRSTKLYQHQSTLRLMLEGLGVKSFPGAAATAPSMWEFFKFPPPS